MIKITLFILYLISFLPIKLIHFLARPIGFLSYHLLKKRRRIGEINLAKCFPEKSDHERQLILKQHFYHMSCMLLEYSICWYASAKRISQLVHYENKEYLDNALKKGNKIIILYPHFCAFEMAVYKLNQDVPLISVYSHQKNKNIDHQILKGRHRYNNVFLVGRTEGLLSIIRTIKKQPAPFLYLPDQDFGAKDSIFVPFFNIPTATTEGLSRIAKLTNAVIIPAIPSRCQNGTFRLRFYPKWEHFPTNDSIVDTARMNAFIEDRIREQPEQYYWLHKRFKTRPYNEADFYTNKTHQ